MGTMGRPSVFQLAIGLTALLFCSNVHASCDNTGGWAKPVYEFLNARLELLSKAQSLKTDDAVQMESYVQELKDFQDKAEQFMKAPLSNQEMPNDCFSMIANLHGKQWGHPNALIKSTILVEDEMERGTVIDDRIRPKTKELLKAQEKTDLPTEDICRDIPSRKFPKEISIEDLCSDVESCTTEDFPYGRTRRGEELPLTQEACTADRKCNLLKAIPMMAGLFWYKVSDWMVERLCPQSCEGTECKAQGNYDKIIHEARLLMSFVGVHPKFWPSKWKTFFHDAVSNRAYMDLEQSLAMVHQQELVFSLMPAACNDLKHNEACQYSDIYKEYVVIKKIQKYTLDKHRLSLVRDLRNLPNINFKARLEQEKSTYQHIELLGTIKALDENLKASVTGISQYFKGLAAYDEGLADADMQFIQGELDKYESSLNEVEAQLKRDIKDIMGKMMLQTVANLNEAIQVLAMKIAEESNPLKLLFNGPDLREVIEATREVANTATDVAKSSALLVSLIKLANDSSKIAEAFQGRNRGQISNLKEIVEKIRQNKANEIGKDGDAFLEDYSGYTPQTDRSQLEKNSALWSAFKDATCDILSGDAGIVGATIKGIVGGKLLCEKLEGTLAQFFTLREDIFDFQFQLVDALAAIIRGSIVRRFSENIKGKGDVLHARYLLIGYFKMQNRFQSTASLFCDIIEYQQQGVTPRAECATVNGLYTIENLRSLIGHSFTAPEDDIEQDLYISTQARFKGDTGYIDLPALARGKTIVFKPPLDTKCLFKTGWISSRDTLKVPFVTKFKLFLPQKEYKIGAKRSESTTTITISSSSSTHVSLEPSKKNIAYILPRRHATFKTIYQESYTICTGQEIDNPYSLCQNLPKICLKSSSKPGSLKLFPTVLSTWNLRYTNQQGENDLKWDAPKPATDLTLRARVTLSVPRAKKRRSHLSKLKVNSDEVISENGCCEGNMVRVSRFNNKCTSCPEKSTSRLQGYYCEINEEEAKKKYKINHGKLKKEKN